MMPPLTFWEHVWQAKWGILIVALFVLMMVSINVNDDRKPGSNECEASGGRLVIPRLDEREAQPGRFKSAPRLICKHDR